MGQPKLLNVTFFKSWEKRRAEGGREENIKLRLKTAGQATVLALTFFPEPKSKSDVSSNLSIP